MNCANAKKARTAFTLIELIVVIAIIALLAGMLFPLASAITRARKLAAARTGLVEVESAIINYHTKTGTYPPSNPGNFAQNALYYELAGTVFNSANNTYTTLDGRSQITATALGTFGVSGLMNSSTSAKGTDEAPGPQNFIQNLQPSFVSSNSATGGGYLVFACPPSVQWPSPKGPISTAPLLVPYQYNSANPTNSSTFDLWADVPIGSRVYRVSNWSRDPKQL